jgi:hypothetical protein
MQTSTVSLGDKLAVSYKAKNSLSIQSVIQIPSASHLIWKFVSTQKHACKMFLEALFINLEMKASKLLLNRWMDKL